MRSLLQKNYLKKAAGLMLGAVLCLAGAEAFAATFTANNNSNNKDWADKQAWTVNGSQPSSGPTASDDVIIPAGQTIPILAGTSVACNTLTVDGSLNNSGSLAIGGGGTLITGTLNNTGILTSTGNMSVSTGILTLAGTANNSFIIGGWLSFGTNGTLILDNVNFLTIPDANNYGNISINSAPTSGMSLSKNLTLAGALTIFAGKKLIVNDPYQVTAGGLSMQAGSELEINGNAAVAYSPVTLDVNSTINYTGSNASIPGGTYAKLKFSGTRTLAGNTTITGSLDLLGGSLIIADKILTLGATATVLNPSTTNYIKVSTGNLTITSVGATAKTFPIGTNSYTPVTIANSGITQNFTVGVKDGVTNLNKSLDHNVVLKTWEITPSGTGANVALTLQWNSTDQAYFGANDPKNFNNQSCAINHFDSGTGKWDPKPTAFVAASGNGPYTLNRTGITTFSPFAVGDQNSPLPVELSYFTAVKKNAEVALTWETASEKNNTGFEVQSSIDGRNYEAVGFVATQNGNASSVQRYAFTHKTGSKEGLVYYRLKQIDLDGSFEYYTAKVVDLGRFTNAANVYPNPFQDQFQVSLQATAKETAQIVLTDMTGKVVYTATQEVQKGANTLNVTLENVPAGLYLLKATAGSQTYINRLVKQ